MDRRSRLRDGRMVLLRPATEGDAADLVRAVDSISREMVYFLRSKFDITVKAETAVITKRREQGSLLVVAILDGRLVGWVSLQRARREFLRHTVELGMGVVRGYRGMGIGTALADYALRWASIQGMEKINLAVRASNERARALYRKFGFVEEGYRVREIKDLHGSYHDSVEMAYFVPQDLPPYKRSRENGQSA